MFHYVDTQQTFALMKTSLRRLQKMSSRRLDQDENIRLNHTSSEEVFKTSSRCFGQDQYIGLGHTSSRRLQHVFSVTIFRLPRRFQAVLRDAFKILGSRVHLCDVRHQQTLVIGV